VRDEIYRIGYEAINNACAHSSGRVVNIALEYGENVTLRVRDDGKGIDLETLQSGREGHFGLKGMHERAERIGARLTLKSVPGKGTEVCLLVPGSVVFKTYQPVKRSRGLHSFFFRRNSHAETTDQHNQHGENAGSS
jgi:signal transduction histidine kinase